MDVANGLCIAGFVALVVGVQPKIGERNAWLVIMLANACFLLACVLEEWVFGAAWAAVFVAYCLWRWWNSGGGDDTKRRLRKLKEKFDGVRRTAPATS
jgi:hypothetical protein